MQHIEEMPKHIEKSIRRNRIYYLVSMLIIVVTLIILFLMNVDLIFKYKGQDQECNCLSANVLAAIYYDHQ